MSNLANEIREIRDRSCCKAGTDYDHLTVAALQLDAAEAEIERLSLKLHKVQKALEVYGYPEKHGYFWDESGDMPGLTTDEGDGLYLHDFGHIAREALSDE